MLKIIDAVVYVLGFSLGFQFVMLPIIISITEFMQSSLFVCVSGMTQRVVNRLC